MSNSPPASTTVEPTTPAEGTPPPRKKRSKLRKLLWGFGLLVLLLILLVIFLPTIASTGPVRSHALSKVSEHLNGRVVADSWSVGWFSGTRLDGLKVYDDANVLVAEVDHLETEATLLKLVRQDFAFGRTVADVNATKVVVYPDGSTNLARLVKSSPAGEEPVGEQNTDPTEAAKLPDVSIDLQLKLRGAVELADERGAVKSIVQLRQGSGGSLKIVDINKGIAVDQKLIYDVDSLPPGTMTLVGTVDAVEQNEVDLKQLEAGLKLDLTDVQLAAAKSLLAIVGVEVTELTGAVNGGLNINITPGAAGAITGELTGSDLRIKHPSMANAYAAGKVSIPVNISRVVPPGSETATTGPRLVVDVKVVAPDASLVVAGDLSEGDLYLLKDRKMPEQAGQLSATVTARPASLAKVVALQDGVRVDGGDVQSVTIVKFVPGNISGTTASSIAINGTRDGQAIDIPKTSLQANASLSQFDNLVAGLKDLSLAIKSDFANANIAGPSIVRLTGGGEADLDKLRQQAAQFVDLSGIALAGRAKFTVDSKPQSAAASAVATPTAMAAATPTAGPAVTPKQATTQATALSQQPAAGAYEVRADVRVDNLKFKMGDMPQVDQPYVSGGLLSNLTVNTAGDGNDALQKVNSATVWMTAGDSPDKLLLDTQLSLDAIELSAKTFRFNLDRMTVNDLASVQKRFIDTLSAALKEQKVQIVGGQMYAVGSGKIDMSAGSYDFDHVEASLPNLKVSRDGKPLVDDKVSAIVGGKFVQKQAGQANTNAGDFSVDVADLQVVSAAVTLKKADTNLVVTRSNGNMSGSGQLLVNGDLVRISQIAKAFAAKSPADGDGVGSAGQDVTAGTVDAKLILASTADGNGAGGAGKLAVDIAGKIAGLSVAKTDINDENITFATSNALPADMTSASMTASLKGSFLSLNADDFKLNLGSETSLYKMVENGKADVGVRDIKKAYAVASALLPGFKLPYTPMSGGMAIKANVSGSDITGDLAISNLSLKNDAGKVYAFDRKKPINARFASKLSTAGDKLSLNISELAADLGVAKLNSGGPIVVGDLLHKPQPSGEIAMSGSLGDLMPLLQFLQSADQPMPYDGQFAATQKFSSDADGMITLNGRVTIDGFALLDSANKPAFSEKQVTLANDLSYNSAEDVADIRGVTFEMASSKALAGNIKGRISKLLTLRKFEKFTADLSGNGGPAWLILFPLLPAETQVTFKDVKVDGPLKATFAVGGSYPAVDAAAKPVDTYAAIKAIVVRGNILLPKIDGLGMDVAPKVLPLTVENGLLITGDTTGDKTRFGQPWDLNNGKLDLGSIVINVADPRLLVSIGRKQKILQGAQLNPVLAAQLGSAASVIFADAKEAGGAINLSVIECQNVPLADLTSGGKRTKASFAYSVKDLKVNGPIPAALSTALQWGGQGIVGDIEDGTFTLNGGIAQQDMTLKLVKMIDNENRAAGEKEKIETRESLRFFGGIDLESQKFKDYKLTISPGLLLRDWREGHPDGMTVELKGKISDASSLISQAIIQIGVQGEGRKLIKKGLEDIFKKDKK